MQSTLLPPRTIYSDSEVMSVDGNSSDFPLTFNSSLLPLSCRSHRVSNFILAAFTATNVVLLFPLYTFILFLGFQQWRKQRSTFTAATMSNADVFTCHMVVMEMIGVLTCVIYCVGIYIDHPEMMIYSVQLFTTTWCVKIQFHMLTCVELYLAVVHPVTYLQLKDSTGVRIRNISVGCVWLLPFLFYILICFSNAIHLLILYFCFVAFVFFVISFCCIAVLWTLRRPAPGDGNQQRVDQSKQRAFNTIATIMAVLWLCLSGMAVCDALESSLLSYSDRCVSAACAVWITLPSTLVLPLLFLQRAGKLPCWKH